MSLVIPDEILHIARMSATELAQEIAILLYQKEKLTLEQASQLAELSRLQFQHLLASRKIPVHYDVAEFEADLETLRERKASMASSPTSQVERIVGEIDRLIAEMAQLRREVAALGEPSTQPGHSVREGEYFGMWADRPDMQGRSSREWLRDLRAQQWSR